jgi:hypothetical protein
MHTYTHTNIHTKARTYIHTYIHTHVKRQCTLHSPHNHVEVDAPRSALLLRLGGCELVEDLFERGLRDGVLRDPHHCLVVFEQLEHLPQLALPHARVGNAQPIVRVVTLYHTVAVKKKKKKLVCEHAGGMIRFWESHMF